MYLIPSFLKRQNFFFCKNIWKFKKEFLFFFDKRSGRSATIGDACQSKKAERHLDESYI